MSFPFLSVRLPDRHFAFAFWLFSSWTSFFLDAEVVIFFVLDSMCRFLFLWVVTFFLFICVQGIQNAMLRKPIFRMWIMLTLFSSGIHSWIMIKSTFSTVRRHLVIHYDWVTEVRECKEWAFIFSGFTPVTQMYSMNACSFRWWWRNQWVILFGSTHYRIILINTSWFVMFGHIYLNLAFSISSSSSCVLPWWTAIVDVPSADDFRFFAIVIWIQRSVHLLHSFIFRELIFSLSGVLFVVKFLKTP